MNAGIVLGPAAIADGQGGFSIETIEVEPPGPREVRVAINASSEEDSA